MRFLLSLLMLIAAAPLGQSFAAQSKQPSIADLALSTSKDRAAIILDGAKKEGALVVYESGPLEAYQGFAQDFMQKYPGIKVDVLRIVGVAQYQRFMQETQARQYIADILSISDQPSMADLAANGHLVDWKIPSFDNLP